MATSKKNFLKIALLFVFAMISNISFGQLVTTIDFETFEAGYTTSVTPSGSGNTDAFNRTDTLINGNSTFHWVAEDISGNPSIDLTQIDVSGSGSFTFAVDFSYDNAAKWDSTDELIITYTIDGGVPQNLMAVQHVATDDAYNNPAALDLDFDGNGDPGQELSISTFITFTTLDIPLSSNSTLDINLQFNNLTSNGEGILIDNIIITETAGSLDPLISVGSAISGLDYFEGFGPSTEGSFPVTGTNLTNDIVLTAPTNFEISTTSVSGFGASINLTPSSGTVSSTTIYSRLQSGLAINTYAGNITATSTGATSQNIALSGDVSAVSNTCLDEGFDGFSGTVPSGWSGSGLGNYTSVASSGIAPNSVQYNSTNDYLETPTLVSPNSLSFWIKGNGTDASSALLVEGWDGSSWNTIENISPISTTEQTKTYSSGLSSYTKFRFTYTKSAGNVAFDDVKVECADPCESVHTITSITPTSGPVNTIVTITGTGFTAGILATIDEENLTIISQTSTEIKARISSGAITGTISLTESPCSVDSANFTIIDSDKTTCEGSVSTSELFISEVTDATVGSLTYIEIYNGTGSDITDLSIYSLKIRYNAGATTTETILAGSVANDDVFVVSIGTQDTNCSVSGGDGSFADQIASTISGIDVAVNSSDCITLIKSGADIDVWGDCADDNWRVNLGLSIGVKGFDFKRLSTATLPSTTFSEADWSITDFVDSPTCGDNYDNIGSYSRSTLPNLISQSNTPPSCASAAVLYVSASEGYDDAGDTKELTYQWYEAAPGVANWTLLTDGGIYSGTTTDNLSISDTSTLNDYQYYCQIRENDATCYQASNSSIINTTNDLVTWNGSWSNGSGPTTSSIVILNSDYSTSVNGSFSCCSLTLDTNVTLDIDATFVSVENDLIINNGAILNVETNTSLIMTYNFGDVALNGTGIINVNKTSTPYEQYDYTYWSSPIVDESVGNALSGSYAPMIFYYNPANFYDADEDGFDDNQDDWISVESSDTMLPGRGYAAMGSITGSFTPTQTQNAIFSGEVNNGFVLQPVTTNNSPNTLSSYNLIGNPYPSAISADEFIIQNSFLGIGGTLYFWTHVNDISVSNPGPDAQNFHSDDYATYNLTGGVGSGSISPNGNPHIPSGIIGSGQGFFIGATQNSLIQFNNSMRDKNYNNTQFFRGTQNQNTQQEKDRIWLNLTNLDGVFNQMLVGFLDKATLGYDRNYDGEYLGSSTFVSLYSMIEERPYAIQGLPKFDINQKIDIGFVANIVGDFKLSIDQIEGVLAEANTDVFLIDYETETIHDLKESDYEFNVVQSGTYNNRFKIVFQEPETTLNVAELESISNRLIISNESEKVLIQYISNNETKMSQLKVYDVLGRVLLDRKLNENNTSLSLNSFVDGSILIFKVELDNGESLTKKFIKL